MREVLVFAVLLFAVFQILEKEPPIKEVVRTVTTEKPVYVEKQVVVREPEIVEKSTERIIVVQENYRQPISGYRLPRAGAYPADYESEINTERRNYREERAWKRGKSLDAYRETGGHKTSKAEIDYECSLKAPNFLGVETKCQEWRKENGYDY